MKNDSAVRFETASRIHMGLAVKNLERSLAFYRALLRQEPTKTRPHYAKFEVAEPPVNLSLNEVGGETGPNNVVAHFGIQVKSKDEIRESAKRLETAGIATHVEENVTCCYAVQNKVWATDPDRNKWEVYVVLDNEGAHHRSSADSCCSDDCCAEVAVVKDLVKPGDLPVVMSTSSKSDSPSCGYSSSAAT